MKNKNADLIKIFLFYHKPYKLLCNNIFQPVLNGNGTSKLYKNRLKPLSIKDFPAGGGGKLNNSNYGELSGHYYILKHWLPEHNKIKYIGFGHYRRILAVTNTLQKLDSPVSDRKMQKLLKKTEESEILNFIENYDIILPEKFSFNCNIVQQYCDSSYPLEDFEAAIKIIKENYPEYIEATEKYLNGNSGYYCLNFLMRKDLYIKCISWIFDILFKLEEERKEIWVNYTEYCNIRTPAYIAERIINIWLIHNIEHYNLKVKETRNIFLETEEVFLQHKPKTFKYFLKRFRLMLKYYLIDIHLRNTENVYSIKFIQNELLETLAYYRNN